jgi:hypothetical protein
MIACGNLGWLWLQGAWAVTGASGSYGRACLVPNCMRSLASKLVGCCVGCKGKRDDGLTTTGLSWLTEVCMPWP